MPRPDIKGIQARCDAAREGPWRSEYLGGRFGVLTPTEHREIPVPGIAAYQAPDAAFIAEARSDIPALLEYISELEDTIRMRREREHYERSCGRDTEAGKALEEIEARRGVDWKGVDP